MSEPRVKFLKKLRALNCVQRWNYHPRTRFENVAEHSYWVTVFTHHFCEILEVCMPDMLDYVEAAIYHDSLEAVTGDLPQPVKRGRAWTDVEKDVALELGVKWTEFKIDERGRRIVKAADLLAAYVFADEEIRMGNGNFVRIKYEISTALYITAPMGLHEFLKDWGVQDIGTQPLKEMSHLG